MDDGARSFILCTNNQNDICRHITYPRLKTVLTGKREDGSVYSDGLPANLKYYHTAFVPKDDENLSDALLDHIAEMIQLEHGVKLDGQHYIMVLDDDGADGLAAHWNEYPNVKALYVSKNVLFTTEQNALFRDVEIHMVTGLTLDLFDFQEQTIMKMLDLTTDSCSKQTIVVKSPTGSGKTIILIGFVDEYLNKVNSNTAIIWLCPGKGDLEEQSRQKMRTVAPHRNTQNLFDALRNGFPAESTTFINWELVTKKGNTAIRDSERKNLYDRIAEAHRSGMEFIVIIDEEHSNNTAKAKDIIDHFSAKNIIRVSATAVQNKRYEYIEIDELDVIDEGLITKALYVNEGIEDNMEITELSGGPAGGKGHPSVGADPVPQRPAGNHPRRGAQTGIHGLYIRQRHGQHLDE